LFNIGLENFLQKTINYASSEKSIRAWAFRCLFEDSRN